MGVKALPSARQAVAARDQRLYQQVCGDLVDLREVLEKRGLGFGFRDNVRQRTWARPTLALLLVTAMERFQRELGDAARKGRSERFVSIGDVSQRGCGQLAHGVLVFHVNGERAENLKKSAHLSAGRLVSEELVRAGDFPWEADRFGAADEKVLVEHELLGEDASGLRVARIRYRELPLAQGEVAAMAREVEALVTRHRASESKVRSEVLAGTGDDSGERGVLHGIDPQHERQALVTLRKKPGRRLDWRDVIEVRQASWQDKKPGSFPNEVRWRVTSAPSEAVELKGKNARNPKADKRPALAADALSWSRWTLVGEAGHISHLSGIDADLSYVTSDNERHFAVDLDAMDVTLTWRWLETLEQTARELGTPLESVLVDAKIKRHLMNKLPQKGPQSVKGSRVWRLLTLVGGHDAHHHIRIGEASDALEKKARQKLGL